MILLKEYINQLITELINPQNLASFVTTILGVFIGFLLSSWQYRKQREKEQNQLELKYTLLIKKELVRNSEHINEVLENIDENFNENKLNKNNMSQKEANQLKEIIKSNSQYLDSVISNNALLSAKRMGALKPIKINEVSNAYDLYETIKNHIKPYQINIDSGKILTNKNIYFTIVKKLRQDCFDLNNIFEEAIEKITELERELK